MKKKLICLISIMCVISLLSWGTAELFGNKGAAGEGRQIVTSFYPMYVLALNLTNGIDGVEVVNLTENQTGCLHDYQLTTKDMRTLSDASIFVMNGGGMEAFISGVLGAYPQLEVIDAGEGIDLLEEEPHEHGGGEVEEEDHAVYNGHMWMDIGRYTAQIYRVCEGLVLLDPGHADVYRRNCEDYVKRVDALRDRYESLGKLRGEKIIIFHDAFAYLADALGMEVVHAVELDTESSMSAGEAAEIIGEIRLHGIRYVFVEEQYKDSVASTIAGETGAGVYVIDSLVTGSGSRDDYIDGMTRNLDLLKELADAKS